MPLSCKMDADRAGWLHLAGPRYPRQGTSGLLFRMA
jgi:hypothetical protein